MKKTASNITYSHGKTTPSKQNMATINENSVQFCQKMTYDEAKNASEELTRRELEKLKRPRLEESNFSNVDNQRASFTYVPDSVNISNNQIEIHRLMCKYADKQQNLCTQICTLNSKLQTGQDRIMSLRDEKYEVETELDHFKGVSHAYETDIEEMRENVNKLTYRVNGCRRQIRNVPFVFLVLLFLYSLCLFEMTHRSSNMLMQYGDYRNWIVDNLS